MVKGFKDKDKKFHPTEKKNSGVSSKDVSNNPDNKKPSKVNPDGADKIKSDKEIREQAEEHGLTVGIILRLKELEGEDVNVEDTESGGSPFGNGDLITLDNGDEYALYDDQDQLRKEAEDAVRQDLEEEPEIFNKDFIDSHSKISDTDARLFGVDAGNIAVEDRELDELKRLADDNNIDYDDPEEEATAELEKKGKFSQEDLGDLSEEKEETLKDKLIDEVSSAIADDVEERIKTNGLRSYIVDDEGLASDEEFMDQYGKSLILDIEGAIDDAIDSDGAEHFISRVDGSSDEVDGGILVKES